ncbi:carbamoyl-phosphate synthase large subunit [Anaerotignum sp. MB30-C6]|uniref:carbamoyl-phosphate synthase large subunit n=1 Tax=Anaerotignum sp. MB30-C6 TaxID=3070814 RepID=UPI0027DD89BD|nr:carbamoyl-phosphate synthase large subunit [Anaerotignum sp. MB30-C6]WMI81182.1 carbamoyl-phosphate synthase large subunit [Anaerotignum sp. MB30-C6]
MPLNKNLKRVMIIGSGPIVIGQAAEFDYAGTQACRALKALGLEVVLINPNPATIMTDNAIADKIYIEPLKTDVIKRIIKKEKPHGLLSTLGGQNGLTLSMQLAKEGFLEQEAVALLGSRLETIDKAEDRLLFKETMEKLNQPCIPSEVVTDIQSALTFAEEIGYPVIVRPAFTLGGSGGGIAKTKTELLEIARNGLEASPIHQILVEQCISGWKEIEFEVMRDGDGNVIAVCSMENFDPVGVHTGDSIVIAPAVTLADKEYQMLRTAALDIITELQVEGGCNVQFALDPESFRYAVIEVNPRVSRSSALASKATGYPIAKVAAQIAVGLTLGEIENAVTGKASAFFEPTLDYVVVKLPKWPFDKFVYAKRMLGTQMKATGEVMAIAPTFEQALLKAVRGAEISMNTLNLTTLANHSDGEVKDMLYETTDRRLFVVYEALKRGISIEEIHDITLIDEWFLGKLTNILATEKRLAQETLTEELYLLAKNVGFLDQTIYALSGQTHPHRRAVYKMVDTCAAEFAAQTPYFYATYDTENEAAEFIESHNNGKKTVIVFGSGPIRIGQGIEFDYASVHCVWTLKEEGYDVVMVNNNPETVSTDFDTADRLYFEPLTPEDVMDIIATEQPYGVVVAFGGQTAIKLTKALSEAEVRILGTSAESIDAAEDREKFDAILEELKMSRPKGFGVMTKPEALKAANQLGYPVLVRPSYVLGGQNMIIAFSDEEVERYMDIILEGGIENPILVDKYLMGTEVEVDAICDGETVLIPGIMEHVERAGIHSGDSIAVYPAWNLSGPLTRRLIEATEKLALALETKGLINIQYVIFENEIYIIEANPRASRTIPYISKVTGLPVVDIATKVMLGKKLKDMPYGTGLYRQSLFSAVKVPVFSFEKLTDVDTHLGPEMKSTGEVLGIGRTLDEAVYKGLAAAGYHMEQRGGVFLTVKKRDKVEVVHPARKLHQLGFELYATEGTAFELKKYGIPVTELPTMVDGIDAIMELLESGKIQYMVSTSNKSTLPQLASVKIRRKATERGIFCLTSIDTTNALVNALSSGFHLNNMELIDIAHLPREKEKLHFTKMRGSGNDYIYFDCFEQDIKNPEFLSVWLSSRRNGIGGDGIVLIEPSNVAHAKMRMFNADGTESAVAGNPIRCVAKYLYDQKMITSENVTIETGNGVKNLELFIRENEVYSVLVHMGKADFEPKSVPVTLGDAPVIHKAVTLGGKEYFITCLSMGNPHCVIFTEDVEHIPLEEVGPLLEKAMFFPERANISFASVEDRTTLRMRVWERGIGETWACGTGACAVAAAAVTLGHCPDQQDITVKLRGGDLIIHCDENTITMTGDARKDFEGFIEI